MSVPDFLRRPVLLSPDNFRPVQETPWGGQVITGTLKAALLPGRGGQMVGESWEFSPGPELPSRVLGSSATLAQLFREYGALVSGVTHGPSDTCDLMLKVIDAAEPLSFQVHPGDDDPALRPGECGKPESWLILAARPGAGIYLGFSRRQSREELLHLLSQGEKTRHMLQFVPVRPGDYFEIEPGVPHAIGAGITLLEPQRTRPGHKGVTWRLWDWERRYDAGGRTDMEHGRPRMMHVAEGLRVIDPESQYGDGFVARVRREPVRVELNSEVNARMYGANPWYRTTVFRFQPGGRFDLDIREGYGAAFVVSGLLQAGDLELQRGQPALLPASCFPLNLTARESSELVVVTPRSAEVMLRHG